MKTVFYLSMFFLLGPAAVIQAQTKRDNQTNIHIYEGHWINKKQKRHLTISFETDQGYFTINDWRDDKLRKIPMTDVYKAWPKDGKLIMPESTSDPLAPYAEILLVGRSILYRTKGIIDPKGKFIDSAFFVRSRR